MKTENTPPIERAATLAGGVAKLASACGVSAQAIYKWINKGYPPVDRCEAVEAAVGGKVTKFDLLPPAFSAKKSRKSAGINPSNNSPCQPSSPNPTPATVTADKPAKEVA